jgi:hypothetical protein
MNAVKIAVAKWYAGELFQGLNAFRMSGDEGQKIVDAAEADGILDYGEVKAMDAFSTDRMDDKFDWGAEYHALWPIIEELSMYGQNPDNFPRKV